MSANMDHNFQVIITFSSMRTSYQRFSPLALSGAKIFWGVHVPPPPFCHTQQPYKLGLKGLSVNASFGSTNISLILWTLQISSWIMLYHNHYPHFPTSTLLLNTQLFLRKCVYVCMSDIFCVCVECIPKASIYYTKIHTHSLLSFPV